MDIRHSNAAGPTDTIIERTESAIRHDPRTAILIALGMGLGMGFVVGLVAGRQLGETARPNNGWLGHGGTDQYGRRMLATISNQVANRFR